MEKMIRVSEETHTKLKILQVKLKRSEGRFYSFDRVIEKLIERIKVE